MEPTIKVTAMEVLKDGTVNYTCTLSSPGQETMTFGLTIYQGQPIICERVEEGSVYGSDASSLL